jgi:endonuclease/exonuclease/phosphatase family metal-dependent hydrolase
MKKYVSTLLLAFSTVATLTIYPTISPIKLMSFNIRRDSNEKNPNNAWKNRKDNVIKLIEQSMPDIVNLQEVVAGKQSDDVEKTLNPLGYRFFGKDRSETMTDWFHIYIVMPHPRATKERNPIGYNTKSIQLIDSGNFGINPPRSFILTAWYEDTLQELPRICTWGRFEDIQQKKQFFVYNTHLDNNSASVRIKQVSIILEHIAQNTKGLPVILAGDLNTKIEGDIKKELDEANFVHAKDMATIIEGPQETRTGWDNSELKEIDHILVKNAKATQYKVIQSPQEKYPSDHRPVCADIIFQ